MSSFQNPYTGQNINLDAAPSYDLMNQVNNAVSGQVAAQQLGTMNPFMGMAFQRTGLYSKLGMTPTGGMNPQLMAAQQRLNNWNPFLQPASQNPHPRAALPMANPASAYQTLFQPASHPSSSSIPYF